MAYQLIIEGVVNNVPALVVWIVAVILSSILMKRGSGKLERFLLVGSILMLVRTILSIFEEAFGSYLLFSESDIRDISNDSVAEIIALKNYGLMLISLVGVIFLFLAIWKKFNEKRSSILG